MWARDLTPSIDFPSHCDLRRHAFVRQRTFVRNRAHSAVRQGGNAMVHHLQREAVQIHEVARYVQREHLATAGREMLALWLEDRN